MPTAAVLYCPLPGAAPAVPQLDARVHVHQKNYQKASSFTEQLRGGTIGVKRWGGAKRRRAHEGKRTVRVAGRLDGWAGLLGWAGELPV